MNGAKRKVANGNRDKADGDLENAKEACNQIGKNMGQSIKPLVDNARGHIDSGAADKTVEIDLDTALAEVENIKTELNRK